MTRGEVTDIAVDPRGIRPVGFDRDDVEAVVDDQALRNRGAGAVELRSAVRRLAEQHHPRIAEPVEQFAERLGVLRRRQFLAVALQKRGDLLRFRAGPLLDEAEIVGHR